MKTFYHPGRQVLVAFLVFVWEYKMVKKATRDELFNAAAGICGRIYGVELKYGPLVAAERARRDRAACEMGVTRHYFV